MVYSERSFQKVNTRRNWSASISIRAAKRQVATASKQKEKSNPHPEEMDLCFANCFTGPADYQSNLDLTGKD